MTRQARTIRTQLSVTNRETSSSERGPPGRYQRQTLTINPSRPRADSYGSRRANSPDAIPLSRSSSRLRWDPAQARRAGQRCPCEPAKGLLRRRIADVDAEQARLQSLRGARVGMADALPNQDCSDPTPGTWLHSTPDREEVTER